MVFGKQLKAALFLIKKIQIHFTTWKNGLDIAVAYQSQSKKGGKGASFVKKGSIVLLLLVSCLTVGIVINKNYKTITATLSGVSVPKTKKKAPLPQAKTTTEVSAVTAKPVDTIAQTTDTLKNVDNTQVKIEEIESTLTVPPPPPIVKPTVKKVEMRVQNDTSEYFIIVANKAVKSIYLLQRLQNKWSVVKEYNIAIGAQEGKKVSSGDKRTPEGQYFIVGRKEYNELSRIYGPLSYVLNYPNEEDRLAGRTGQGIWIHGTDPDSLPMETRGCLEMENRDLDELSKVLKKGIGTPVLIVNNELLSDPTMAPDYIRCEKERKSIRDKYQTSIGYFKAYVENWKRAWETKNIVEYTKFYDTLQFKAQGLDWNGWKERKLRTFSLYDTISITIDNVLITDYGDRETIVKFMQIYKTNINSNEVAKKLSLVKIDDSWKISSESTCLKEELLL